MTRPADPRLVEGRVDRRALRAHVAGHGPALVHLHDAGAETLGSEALRRAADRCEVWQVELPGYGASDPPDGLGDPAAVARLVAAWLDAHGPGRAAVAGTSLGGWIALEMAVERPDLVAALGLIDAAGTHVPPGFLHELYLAGQARVDDPGELLAGGLARLPADERDLASLPPRLAAAVAAPLAGGLAAAVAAAWHPLRAAEPTLRRAEAVRCPSLLLWGALDPLIPASHGALLAAALPHARLQVLRGVGHLPPVEAPEEVAEALVGLAGDG